MHKRILGYDFARAFAIFGMVIVNFKIVMSASAGSEWILRITGLLEGRAAAIFVILAGVGLSLMTAKSRSDPSSQSMSRHRISLLKRALLLVVVGLSYSPIWPADILHFYGFYIAIGVLLLTVKDRTLILCAIVLMIGFVALFFIFDYATGWNWTTLAYTDFWTLRGMARHIFFNGFHPVFPWASFLLIGMWLGRQNIVDVRIRRRIMLVSLILLAGTELISREALICFGENGSGLSESDVLSLFGTKPMPPLPQYVLSAGSTAVLFIMLCVSLTSRFADASWVGTLCKTGQMSLTLYVAHVVIGMGFLESIGRLENQTIEFAVVGASLFNLSSVVFAYFWISKFRAGPLEQMFRKLSG